MTARKRARKCRWGALPLPEGAVLTRKGNVRRGTNYFRPCRRCQQVWVPTARAVCAACNPAPPAAPCPAPAPRQAPLAAAGLSARAAELAQRLIEAYLRIGCTLPEARAAAAGDLRAFAEADA